ncbi:MAG: hypothetical protein QOK40_3665, partial [Miltoncostaeaceae bacterium]|nr:hypothetical protein [Miltoncostaeaceae bacterium]
IRLRAALGLALAGSLALVPSALAHAIVSPPVATKALQQFTLSVPTEEPGATTVAITMTVPSGFAIDSFEPAAGWTRRVTQTGAGEEAVVRSVTWSGGAVRTGEDAVFRFNASAPAGRTYAFPVRQTYSDGRVVEWTGPDGSDAPAPMVLSVSSIGGGSSSTLAIVALIVGSLGVVVAVLALAAGRRPLA